MIDFDTLSNECSEPLGLILGKVEMEPRVALVAGDADREPAVAGSEGDIALNQGALGMGSGELCHDEPYATDHQIVARTQRHRCVGMGQVGPVPSRRPFQCQLSAKSILAALNKRKKFVVSP
jgi:hypothetical protein